MLNGTHIPVRTYGIRYQRNRLTRIIGINAVKKKLIANTLCNAGYIVTEQAVNPNKHKAGICQYLVENKK